MHVFNLDMLGGIELLGENSYNLLKIRIMVPDHLIIIDMREKVKPSNTSKEIPKSYLSITCKHFHNPKVNSLNMRELEPVRNQATRHPTWLLLNNANCLTGCNQV